MLTFPVVLGCGDNSCVFGRPGGMATNGGCCCLSEAERSSRTHLLLQCLRRDPWKKKRGDTLTREELQEIANGMTPYDDMVSLARALLDSLDLLPWKVAVNMVNDGWHNVQVQPGTNNDATVTAEKEGLAFWGEFSSAPRWRVASLRGVRTEDGDPREGLWFAKEQE